MKISCLVGNVEVVFVVAEETVVVTILVGFVLDVLDWLAVLDSDVVEPNLKVIREKIFNLAECCADVKFIFVGEINVHVENRNCEVQVIILNILCLPY